MICNKASLIALVCALVGAAAAANLHPREYYEAKFVLWMKEHGMSFEDGHEFVQRLNVFAANDDFIAEENAKAHSYTLGHNKYSIYTHEEFKHLMNLGKGMPNKQPAQHVHTDENIAVTASSVDWEADGAVTPVKDQGSCGSCWAFSTTGAMEGAYKIKKGALVSFSEQQLVSCDNLDSACDGGLMDYAFTWIKKNGGICTETAYPYTSGSGSVAACKTTCTEVSGTTVASYTDVSTTESALQTAVSGRPVSVAIEADQLSFQLYSSGVFTANCGTSLDHGVLAVGYGVYTDGTPYWKVKNSWGTSWGMSGYILLEKDTGSYGGKCGITLSASYPTI